MRRILLLFLLLQAMTVTLNAQIASGKIAGFVDGAPLQGVWVKVFMYDSAFTSLVYYDSSLTTVLGYFETNYSFPIPPSKGRAFIYFDDCHGLTYFDTASWDTTASGSNIFKVYEYCGKTAPCSSLFTRASSGLTVNFTNLSATTFPDSTDYTWSFGDGSFSFIKDPVHNYTSGGTYLTCLHVLDVYNNCADTYCDSFQLIPPSAKIISGTVTKAGQSPGDAEVYLYRSAGDNLYLLDSVHVNDTVGNPYEFPVDTGAYYVRARLSTFHPEYDDYLPAYFEKSLSWTGATAIIITTAGSENNDIDLLQGGIDTGPGNIGGNIILESTGNPYPNATVILTNDTGKGIYHTISDANGDYIFPDLSYGSYRVFVDIPGKTSYVRMADLSSAVQDKLEENFIVQDKYVTTGAGELPLIVLSKLYPNPANDYVLLSLETLKAARAELIISDLSGRPVIREPAAISAGTQNITVNIGRLPTGVYLVNIVSEEGIWVEKFIKK